MLQVICIIYIKKYNSHDLNGRFHKYNENNDNLLNCNGFSFLYLPTFQMSKIEPEYYEV